MSTIVSSTALIVKQVEAEIARRGIDRATAMMNDQAPPVLLPCPFCGSVPTDACLPSFIECTTCGTLGPEIKYSNGVELLDAVTGWNTRAPQPPASCSP